MQRILITGGAGFIGSNAAKYFADRGWAVTVFDNFSRQPGTSLNARWLHEEAPTIVIVKGDVRHHTSLLEKLVSEHDVVLHLAGQVAVTTSVQNPREDFEINALGTLNVLEAVRTSPNKPILLYASTNKVYGGMERVPVIKTDQGYRYRDLKLGAHEDHHLDFHSPYGCSKGTADQYIRDYARLYDLKTVVFRQSCIYGPRQFGSEDQGWVVWFVIAHLLNKKATIFGDGHQSRDVLFIDDLNRAYELAIANIDKVRGRVYNIGGGATNVLSVLGLVDLIQELYTKPLAVEFADWRPGDQKIFCADVSKAQRDFGWQPTTTIPDGVQRLYQWVKEHEAVFLERYA